MVGVTATPQRTDGKGLGDVFQSLVIGPTALDLIKWGNLAPEMTYSLPTSAKINRAAFRKSHGDYVSGDVERAMMEANVFGDIVEHYQRLTPGRQAICYCITRSYSQAMAERFEAAGIPAAHVDCKTGRKDREKAIESFRRGETKVLCNVDLFGEGFDVPAVGVVILARPTASLILHIQQTMRAMRADPKEPGKRAIILDHVGNMAMHDLPEIDRTWSLDDRKAKGGKPASLKTCPECYLTVSAAVRKCPGCGYEWPKEADEENPIRQAKEDKSVDLVLYGESEMLEQNHAAFMRKLRVPEMLKQARTMQDLQNIARYAGYKPGWAYYRAKAMGIRS
jgi:superfamily II DNA or RNA helicase